MAITFEMIKQVTAQLYERSLKQIPDDTRQALVQASSRETNETGRRTLQIMVESADAARRNQSLVCSDSGVPVYFMQIGTKAQFDGNVKQAIEEGFAELVATINPPLLPHVTNPLTLERGYQGKGMPITTFDLVDGADYIDITCSPKAQIGRAHV